MVHIPDLQACDVLAFGPHPDDVEIAASGTLLLLMQHGLTATIVDFTRGEKGSRGTAADRDAEARAAAGELGLLQRHNLGLPDTGLVPNPPTVELLVRALRSARPQLLFPPLQKDVHPDHVAAAEAVSRAFFLAGLKNFAPELGAPHRPRLLLRYPGNQPIEPTIAVDISALVEKKATIVRCYASQIASQIAEPKAPAERGHLVQGLDLLERAEVRDRFFGARIGVHAAEGFWHDGPLPVRAIETLLG